MKNFHGLILAGGRGTRFWPLSRRASAKQVLRLFGERSLIQQTVDRLKPVLPPGRIWILTNDHLRAEIVKQLPEVPARQILAEPAQRNTAPAIGLAAKILHGIDPESVMGVFPADHVIGNPRSYVRQLKIAIAAAQAGKIVTLGIEPRWAETGYGYIEFSKGVKAGAPKPLPVRNFREKPDAKTAEKFLRAGNFFWNAGMFFGTTAVWLEELRHYLPKTSSLLASLPVFGERGFAARLEESYAKCDNISIDFAVLEKSKRVVGLPMAEFGWNDVGSWNAVYELHGRDKQGNAVRSSALVEDSTGNFVDAKKLVALLGVHDLVIVDTPDALLVADRKRAQQVGDIVKLLEKGGHHHLL